MPNCMFAINVNDADQPSIGSTGTVHIGPDIDGGTSREGGGKDSDTSGRSFEQGEPLDL